MKFIHTADLHLDSPLRGLSNYPEAPAERLRTATRQAFEALVQLALDERVDFLVIAGDVYDGDWKDFNTGLFFVRQMGRLRQAGIPVYLLYGNHDAESEMTRGLLLPDNVHVFSSGKAETFCLSEHRVAVHGRSFKDAATVDNLLPSYPDPIAGWLNIGVLHTALEGHAEHARYAPCSVAELKAKGYQYWALGHVHAGWVAHGEVTIAYPGNLQGRHIRETGERGALLVHAEGGEITGVQKRALDVLRWHVLNVDIAQATDMRDCLRRLGTALAELLASTPAGLPLAVRVVFTGTSAVHAELLAQAGQLRQEAIAQAVALDADRLWIEKVQLASQALPPAANPSEVDVHDVAAVLGEYAKQAADDAGFVQSLQADWQQLLSKVPLEALEASLELNALRKAMDAQLPERLTQATQALMSRVVRDAPPASNWD